MAKFYSALTRGFYDTAVHGSPRLLATDGDGRVVEVPNPACQIPPDAVEIGEEDHTRLLVAQSAGKVIEPGAGGRPVAVEPAADLDAYLPQKRWETETGGTAWNGWRLPTDDRSQAKYLAELAAVNEGARQDGQVWKFPHGFEMLTNQQVRDMAAAARAHVLRCFSKEAEVAEAIAQGTITVTAEIDAAFVALQ